MSKKLMTVIAVVSVLIVMLSSVTVFCEEEANPVPDLKYVLNADGTTTYSFFQPMDEESVDQSISQISERFTEEGYTVEKSQDPMGIILTKTFPAEQGYIIDLSLAGYEPSSFIEFKDFFINRYGIKNTSFNFEKYPEGQTLLKLTIQTPVKPAYSNAETRDETGKINTWVIKSASKNEISLAFKKYNVVPLISTIFGLAVLLVLLYFIITTNKKNKSLIEGSGTIIDSDEGLTLEGEQMDEDMDSSMDEPMDEPMDNPVEEMEFDVEAQDEDLDDTTEAEEEKQL